MFSPEFPTVAAGLIFGEPGWFWALAMVPALALWFVRAERRAGTKLAKIVSPRLRAQLTDGVLPGRRRLRYALLLAGLSLLITAAARPQLGFDSLEVKRRGLDLIIGIDTSKSMLATDVEPNRLTRAKLAAQDLIGLSQGDRLGLIAFAGRAFLQAPLTIDYGAVISAVQDLDTEAVPRGGTNIAEAIQLALDAFGKGEGADRVLVLMTDGEELEADAVTMAKKAAAAGVKIFCLGIGSSEGSLLPLPGGGFVRDRAGQMVRSRLDESRLREIASAADGRYMRLTAGPEAIEELYRDGIAQLKRKELEMKTTQRPIERYAWPLSTALILIALGALLRERKSVPRPLKLAARKKPERTAAAVLLALIAAIAIPDVYSASTAPTAPTAPTAREAMRQYRDGKYGEAESNFDSLGRQHPNSARFQFNLGAAAYKKGDYARAAEAFGRALAMPDSALHETTFYNLGNTLYQQGAAQQDPAAKLRDWENAIAHYDNALRLNPKDGDALANRAFVKRAMEEEKTKQPPPPQKGGGDDKSKSNKSDQQKSKDKREKNKDSSKQDPSQDQQKNDDQSKDDKSAKPEANDSSSVPDKNDPQSDENRPPKGDDSDSSDEPMDSNGQQRSGRDSQTPPSAPSQENRPQGDFQAREPQAGEPQEVAEASAAQDDGSGKLSAAQARQLLEALKGEDDKIFLNEKLRRQESSYKDW